MKIKINRREFDIDNRDKILDNGACYILITQQYYKDFGYIQPTFPKYIFKRLEKEGFIVKSKSVYKTQYETFPLYRFRIDGREEEFKKCLETRS